MKQSNPLFFVKSLIWASPPYQSLSWPHWKVPPYFPPVVTFFVGRYHNHEPHDHFFAWQVQHKGTNLSLSYGIYPQSGLTHQPQPPINFSLRFSEVSSIDSTYNLCVYICILQSVRYGELANQIRVTSLIGTTRNPQVIPIASVGQQPLSIQKSHQTIYPAKIF